MVSSNTFVVLWPIILIQHHLDMIIGEKYLQMSKIKYIDLSRYILLISLYVNDLNIFFRSLIHCSFFQFQAKFNLEPIRNSWVLKQLERWLKIFKYTLCIDNFH